MLDKKNSPSLDLTSKHFKEFKSRKAQQEEEDKLKYVKENPDMQSLLGDLYKNLELKEQQKKQQKGKITILHLLALVFRIITLGVPFLPPSVRREVKGLSELFLVLVVVIATFF